MVDDEEQFRATTKKLLTGRGFETVLAESGEEAIEKLKEYPDVVVLDIKMPQMDGHQALKEIKKRAPRIPVIMLTGFGDVPSAENALAEGAFDYLSKPCDIGILSAKITDAHLHGSKKGKLEERLVRDVMIPLAEYTTITEDQTVRDAIMELKKSFSAKVSTSRIMETGHRSLLVFDRDGNVRGILAITDLLESIMPAYLNAPKPSTADSVQYSPMFWKGLFSIEVKKFANKKVGDVMSPSPPEIDCEANLMVAAYRMVNDKIRRLVVVESGRVVGMIREQDLFFEMERIQSEIE